MQNPNVKGWNSHVRRTFPGSFASTNLSRDNLIREIGREGVGRQGIVFRHRNSLQKEPVPCRPTAGPHNKISAQRFSPGAGSLRNRVCS